jgi:hypothetical protein
MLNKNFVYLFSGNVTAISGEITVVEANGWRISLILFLIFIAGCVILVSYTKGKQDSNREQSPQNRSRYYNNSNGNGSHRPDFNSNNNHSQEFMEDLTRQQHQQFVDEADMQNQQFIDDMNYEMNLQQQHEFEQWSSNESMHSVDDNFPQGFY